MVVRSVLHRPYDYYSINKFNLELRCGNLLSMHEVIVWIIMQANIKVMT